MSEEVTGSSLHYTFEIYTIVNDVVTYMGTVPVHLLI